MDNSFSFQIRVDGQVDERLCRHFTDLCRTLQTQLGAIASEQRQLHARVAQLEAENQALRSRERDPPPQVAAPSPPVRRGPPPEPEETGGRARVAAPSPPVRRGPPGQGLPEPQRPLAEPEETGSRARVNRGGSDNEQPFALNRTIKIHEAPVHSLKMGPSGDTVATASWDATVKLYNLGAEEVVQTLGRTPGEEMGGLYAVAFSKTSPSILGCTSNDCCAYIWDHQTGTLSSKLSGHTDEVNGIDFHSSQHVICTVSDDCKAIIWDIHEGIALRTFDQHTKAVYGAAFLGMENQYLVATCCFDQKTRIFDMRDKKVTATLHMHTDDVVGIDYNSPKQLLATGSDDGIIGLWDARNYSLMQKIDTRADIGIPDNEVKRVAFSPNGDLLAAACSTGRVLVYDVRSQPGQQHAALAGHGDCVFDVAWGVCPQTSAKILVSASHDHTFKYWREVLQ